MTLVYQLIYLGLVLGALYVVLVAILNLLPAGQPLPMEFVDGIEYFFGLIRGLDFILPMDAVMGAIAVFVTYEILKVSINMLVWSIQQAARFINW